MVNLLLQAAALRGSLPVPPPELLPAVEPLPRYEYRSELYQRDGFGRQVEDGASTTLAALSVVKFGLSVSGLGLDGMLTTGLVPKSPTGTSATNVEQLFGKRLTGADLGDDIQVLSDAKAEALYEQIRGLQGDVQAIARNTGIPEEVVSSVRQHLFFDKHLLEPAQGVFEYRRFDADDLIGQLWMKAVDGKLTPVQAKQFERIVAHEYVERGLMKTGVPYRSSHPDAWKTGRYDPTPQAHGAHDIAPVTNVNSPPFSHWPDKIGVTLKDR